jgi:hypothetical protein
VHRLLHSEQAVGGLSEKLVGEKGCPAQTLGA